MWFWDWMKALVRGPPESEVWTEIRSTEPQPSPETASSVAPASRSGNSQLALQDTERPTGSEYSATAPIGAEPDLDLVRCLNVRTFSGPLVDSLTRELEKLAPEMNIPADRLLIASLLRAVKNEGVRLPLMPTEMLKIQRMISSPDCDIAELAKTIERNPSIAGKLLGVANSVFYRTRSDATSLEAAIMRIGLRGTSIVVTAIISREKFFQLKGQPELGNEICSYSLATGATAQLLARRARLNEQDAFMAGLLHDLGRVFVLSTAEDIRRDSRGALAPKQETVESVADYLHADLGALIAEQWHLPPELVTAIRYHHNPYAETSSEESVENRFAFALYCAGTLGHRLPLRPLELVLPDQEQAALDDSLRRLGVADLGDLWSDAQSAFSAYDRNVVGKPPTERHARERAGTLPARDDGPTPA